MWKKSFRFFFLWLLISKGVDRHHFNAIVTQQDLDDTYLIPFKYCVTRGYNCSFFLTKIHFSSWSGKVSSIMCSENSVNGIPSCANEYLIGQLARDQWNFEVWFIYNYFRKRQFRQLLYPRTKHYSHGFARNRRLTCPFLLFRVI